MELATGVYANYALVHHTTVHEITIDFCQVSDVPPRTDGASTARIVARIHIAPSFVTPLLKAISENAFRQEDAIKQIRKGEGEQDEPTDKA